MEPVIVTFVAIFALSLFFSMFGRGGGEFYLPTMISLLTIPFYKAAGVNLFLIFIQGLSMVLVYSLRNKLVDWAVALVMAVVVGTFAFSGGFFSHKVPDIYLKILFAVFLLVSAYYMLKNKAVKPVRGKFGVWHREFAGQSYDVNILYLVPPVALAAFVAGMVGISGCGLIVPLYILLGGVPMSIAMGTNTFLVLTSSSMSFIGHLLKGGVDWKLGLILGAAVLIGSQIGSRLHTKVSEKFLKVGFVVILIVAALWMIVKIFV